jgi:hypothetical protein
MQCYLIVVVKTLRLLTQLRPTAMTTFAVNDSAAEERLGKFGSNR